MDVDGDGLQHHRREIVGGAGGRQVGLHHGARGGHGHGLEPLEHQRGRHVDREVVVVGDHRSAPCHSLAFEILGYHQETEDAPLLHHLHRFVIAFGLCGHIDQLHGVERAGHLARELRMVEVDHGSRHFKRQAGVEQAHEEEGDEHRHKHHRHEVDGARCQTTDFSADYG